MIYENESMLLMILDYF